MKPLYQQYTDAKPIGVLAVSNFGGLVILDLNDEFAVSAWDFGAGYQQIHRNKICYSKAGRPYINKGHTRYFLDQIARCNYG